MPTPPTRCPQYRPPLLCGPASDDAILLGGRVLQCLSQACLHHWAVRAYRQRPTLPGMGIPARRTVSRPEEHFKIYPPTCWLRRSDLLVRGEAIDVDHGYVGCAVLTSHNKPPASELTINQKEVSQEPVGLRAAVKRHLPG